MPRLNCEMLETRENPAGPALVDPIGIPTTEAAPAIVTPEPAPTTPAATDTSVIDCIILDTLAALARGF